MSPQNLSENSFDDIVCGSIHGDRGEVPLETKINCERS